MKLLIVVQHRFELWLPPAWFAQRLRADFPEVQAVQFSTYEQADPELDDAEAIMTWSLRPEQIARARKLRWIHSPAAAVHALMIPEIIDSDVVVTNSSSVHGPVVAEHAMALVLALARRIPSAVRHQRQRQWAQQQLWREHPRPRELSGATVGVLGAGAIGGTVVQRALQFGMNVLAIREHPERGADFMSAGVPDSGSLKVLGFQALDEVLPQCDFVVLAVPLTCRTTGLMNAARVACMKPEAYLINVGRGALVDECALADAVRSGHIGGAALDVFTREPLPPESPLWDLPNVLITPHAAGMTERIWERHYSLLSENLRRYLAGQPLLAVVDKRKGY
jgi:phosphoglycerate dehydrogenase-like enzyme